MAKDTSGLSEPVYGYILNLIFTKQLLPGDRVFETKIAEPSLESFKLGSYNVTL